MSKLFSLLPFVLPSVAFAQDAAPEVEVDAKAFVIGKDGVAREVELVDGLAEIDGVGTIELTHQGGDVKVQVDGRTPKATFVTADVRHVVTDGEHANVEVTVDGLPGGLVQWTSDHLGELPQEALDALQAVGVQIDVDVEVDEEVSSEEIADDELPIPPE